VPSRPPMRPRAIEIGKWRSIRRPNRVSHSETRTAQHARIPVALLPCSAPNRVFTRINCSMRSGVRIDSLRRSVDVYVRRLREKIESDPENPVHWKRSGARAICLNPCGLISSGKLGLPFFALLSGPAPRRFYAERACGATTNVPARTARRHCRSRWRIHRSLHRSPPPSVRFPRIACSA